MQHGRPLGTLSSVCCCMWTKAVLSRTLSSATCGMHQSQLLLGFSTDQAIFLLRNLCKHSVMNLYSLLAVATLLASRGYFALRFGKPRG